MPAAITTRRKEPTIRTEPSTPPKFKAGDAVCFTERKRISMKNTQRDHELTEGRVWIVQRRRRAICANLSEHATDPSDGHHIIRDIGAPFVRDWRGHYLLSTNDKLLGACTVFAHEDELGLVY